MNIIAQNYHIGIEEAFHETKIHGQPSFPYTVYRGNIPGYLHSYPLHWHDEMEIMLAEKGCAICMVGTERRLIKAGDIALITPQTAHSVSRYKKQTFEYFTLLFKFRLLCPDERDELFKTVFLPLQTGMRSLPCWIPPENPLNKALFPYLRDLIDNRHEPGFRLKIKSDLFGIMHELQKRSAPTEEHGGAQGKYHERLKKIILFVRQNYAREITVAQAAEFCSLSPSHFMKLFKEMTGCGFISYVNDFRLETAARMLTETDNNALETAGLCGFSNASYFTRAFKKKHGVPPSAYKKSRRLKTKAKTGDNPVDFRR